MQIEAISADGLRHAAFRGEASRLVIIAR